MTSKPSKDLIIYTDGSCLGNPGPGGWAAILMYGTHRKELSGGQANTTNNRMELMAAIEGLSALKEPCSITLFTDSSYLQKGMTEWIKGWKKKGLLTQEGSRIANRDLWQTLDQLNHTHRVEWRWVRAHNGTEENERADQLARSAAEKIAGR